MRQRDDRRGKRVEVEREDTSYTDLWFINGEGAKEGSELMCKGWRELKGVTQQKGKKDDFINTIIWSYCTSCDGAQSTAIAAINGASECRCDFLCIILAHCLYWIFDITLKFEQ